MQKESIDTDSLIRKEKAAYFKSWRDKNKDKVKLYNRTYWQRKIKNKILESEAINNNEKGNKK